MKTKRYVAVASPCGVLLESPYFGPPTSSRFHDKETSLNLYTEATSKVAETLNIPYIDIRTPFLNAIPQYRLAYKGLFCFTFLSFLLSFSFSYFSLYTLLFFLIFFIFYSFLSYTFPYLVFCNPFFHIFFTFLLNISFWEDHLLTDLPEF